MGVAAVMLVLFYISALKAGRDVTQELAGTTHWLVFPFVQAFTFTAGMSILMTGVRMFLSEITAAFVSISEKFIPNSRPALDVPTVFPFAPTAVIVGFLSSLCRWLIGSIDHGAFQFSSRDHSSSPYLFLLWRNSRRFWKPLLAVGGERLQDPFVIGLLLAFYQQFFTRCMVA